MVCFEKKKFFKKKVFFKNRGKKKEKKIKIIRKKNKGLNLKGLIAFTFFEKDNFKKKVTLPPNFFAFLGENQWGGGFFYPFGVKKEIKEIGLLITLEIFQRNFSQGNLPWTFSPQGNGPPPRPRKKKKKKCRGFGPHFGPQ